MIEIKDLAFSYGKTPILKSITTTLEEGRIYGLLGENGVGKTTLLTLLCGLKKVCSGSITTDGENPFDRTPTLLQNQFYASGRGPSCSDEGGVLRKGKRCLLAGLRPCEVS